VACCSPLSREPISQTQAEQIAPLLKALADPVRLRLMSLVACHAISHHLKVLHEVGMLDRSKRGVWVYYRIRPAALAGLAQLIGDHSPS
jgi:ArsR family transcriptional regulator